jgi:hypothetical protein
MVCEPRAPASRQRAPTRQQPQPQHLLPQPRTCSMQPQPQATSQPQGHTCALRASGFVLRAWCMVDGHVDVWILDSGFWIGFKSAAGEVCVVCLLACWRGVCCGCVVCARLMLRNSASASASRSVHSVHCISRNSYAIQRPPSTLAIKLYRTLICNIGSRRVALWISHNGWVSNGKRTKFQTPVFRSCLWGFSVFARSSRARPPWRPLSLSSGFGSPRPGGGEAPY